MLVKNGSDNDVSCMRGATGPTFLFTEGKESACLPRYLLDDGHHLCSFGFATKVASINWEEPQEKNPPSEEPPSWYPQARGNDDLRGNLQVFLRVGGDKVGISSVRLSARTNSILRDHSLVTNPRNIVHARLREGLIPSHDPVNLWAVVMQACLYSIKKGRSMTLVQSARMWWFIQLNTNKGTCVVRVSSRSISHLHMQLSRNDTNATTIMADGPYVSFHTPVQNG